MGNARLGNLLPIQDALRVLTLVDTAAGSAGGSAALNGGVLNKIYVWHADGSTLDIFDPDQAGLIAALAAAAAGDTVWLPSIPITLTAGITVPASVAVRGLSAKSSFDFGSIAAAITLGDGSRLEWLQISVIANDANDQIVVQGPASGIAYLTHCRVECTQSGAGDAVAVNGGDGQISINDSFLNGQSGSGAGYGVVNGDGVISIDDSFLVGSTAPLAGAGTVTAYVAGAEISSGAITVDSGAGNTISGLSVSSWYAVECTGGPFNANPEVPKDSYHYTVSNDGGANWEGLLGNTGDAMELTAPSWGVNPVDLDGNHARFFFQATGTSIKIRTGDFFWADNTGSLGWRLRAATAEITGIMNILTHACRMATVLGEPVLGDRGVWDALNYQARHANDIDHADGIHHTLGSGGGQVAPGDHTHSIEVLMAEGITPPSPLLTEDETDWLYTEG